MDEDDADAALRAALDQLAFATRSAAALSSTLDAVEGLRRVCRVLVPGLADWAAADLMDEDGAVERVCFSHRDPNTALTGLTGPLPPVPETATGPLSRVLRGSRPAAVVGRAAADRAGGVRSAAHGNHATVRATRGRLRDRGTLAGTRESARCADPGQG